MSHPIDLRQIQAGLKERYRADPASARVVTGARSVDRDLSDPRHCAAAPSEFPAVVIEAGLHPAAGGAGDTPCSGDILATALAVCEESTLRSVAANLGLELESVKVEVRVHWDFRGTMGVDPTVPVEATAIEMWTRVKVRDGIDPERARRLLASAERYCSTLQTLRKGVAEVRTDLAIEE
ncbi:MAG TPA: OsmC family protein [Candidatus Dormibacteraeota bacterium]|nr:OsmC family protein [Candidatus Dormibacteraeota bacterium]